MTFATYADLKARVAELEKRLRRDRRSFSPLLRETAVSPRRRTREKRLETSTFSHLFPLTEAALESR